MTKPDHTAAKEVASIERDYPLDSEIHNLAAAYLDLRRILKTDEEIYQDIADNYNNDLLRQKISQFQIRIIDLESQLAEWQNGERQYPPAVEDHREMLMALNKLKFDHEELRKAARDSLDARNKEAKTCMAAENAYNNFSNHDAEYAAHEEAMIEASIADAALRKLLEKST